MSFSQNRFDILLGDEETEVDKLGNTKPAEKKGDAQPPTRRDLRRAGQRQPAVSPPSRRERGSRRGDGFEGSAATSNVNDATGENKSRSKPGRSEFSGRGRQYDRHSGTGIIDNEKKITQGWGEAGTAEYESANDVLDPNDPAAAETRHSRAPEETEENTKTLDEYLAEKKSANQNLRLNQGRQANEGSDDAQWKDTVVLEKEEAVFFPGKESEVKLKNKSKKEKVYLEIDQPSHRSSSGGRGGRGGRGRSNNRHSANSRQQGSVNLSDASAFPTLGA
ncbi:hypothetical protein BD560DRAFT_411778 [Blakeslea trispora]|nr:hypothetical protein BD560DRAFT_411778 [Blakeslea trispora]